MSSATTLELASNHLTEVIRHLSSAAALVRGLSAYQTAINAENADALAHLALIIDGQIETARDVRGHVEKIQKPSAPVLPALQDAKGRSPKKSDRRSGDRRASRRRVDDKRKASLRTKGSTT